MDGKKYARKLHSKQFSTATQFSTSKYVSKF